jgi:hypothetical protein
VVVESTESVGHVEAVMTRVERHWKCVRYII